jgi:hypothetical protein
LTLEKMGLEGSVMKRILVVIGVWLLSLTTTQAAISVAFDTITADQVTFTVDWGSQLEFDSGVVFSDKTFTDGVHGDFTPKVFIQVQKQDQFSIPFDTLMLGFCGSWLQSNSYCQVVFPNAPATDVNTALISFDPTELSPSQLTPTADGYGFQMTLTRSQTDPTTTLESASIVDSIPDAGPSSILIALSVPFFFFTKRCRP